MKLALQIVTFVCFVLGYALLIDGAGWGVAIAVWLIHFSINCEHDLRRRMLIEKVLDELHRQLNK